MSAWDVVSPLARVGGQLLAHLDVTTSLTSPWRTAHLGGPSVTGRVKAFAGYQNEGIWTVFDGAVDTPATTVYRPDEGGDRRGLALARGLPEWRRDIGPQSFQDVRLETLIAWLAAKCGGCVQCDVRGAARRSYLMPRGPAHRALKEALTSWRSDAALVELDDGTLYVGPEARTPFATARDAAVLVYGENILSLTDLGDGRWRLVTPLMPWLRVTHRLRVTHPLLRGRVRVTQARHVLTPRDVRTDLEVHTL